MLDTVSSMLNVIFLQLHKQKCLKGKEKNESRNNNFYVNKRKYSKKFNLSYSEFFEVIFSLAHTLSIKY